MSLDMSPASAPPTFDRSTMGRRSYLTKRIRYLEKIGAHQVEVKSAIKSLEFWQFGRTAIEHPRLRNRTIKTGIRIVTFIAFGVAAEAINSVSKALVPLPSTFPARTVFYSFSLGGFLLFICSNRFQQWVDYSCEHYLDPVKALFSERCWVNARYILDKLPASKHFFNDGNLKELSRRFNKHYSQMHYSSVMCNLLSRQNNPETREYLDQLWDLVKKDSLILNQMSSSGRAFEEVWQDLSETRKKTVLDRVFSRLDTDQTETSPELPKAENAVIDILEQQEDSDQKTNVTSAIERALRLHRVSLHPSKLEQDWWAFTKTAGYFAVTEPELIRYTGAEIDRYQEKEKRPQYVEKTDLVSITRYWARTYMMQPDKALKPAEHEFIPQVNELPREHKVLKSRTKKRKVEATRQSTEATVSLRVTEEPILVDSESIFESYPLQLTADDSRMLKTCINQITSFSDWDDKDHGQLKCTNWTIAGRRTTPVYHCSVGKKGTVKTLTLIYTRNGNELVPIALARHSRNRRSLGTYDIESYFPGWQGQRSVNINWAFDFSDAGHGKG